jgi:hypothetical protein
MDLERPKYSNSLISSAPFRGTLSILAVFLSLCLAYFVAGTWQWPLVGDASIIHYVAFLMDHGLVPYRQIVDMNMPGSYLVEWLLMHVFGGGSLSWRLVDFALMAAAGAAMIILARSRGWFPGFAAAALLALIHGQDGIAFQGERDLIIATLLGWAFAFLFLAARRDWAWCIGAAGLVTGIAVSMKPLAILFAVPLLASLAACEKSRRRSSTRAISWAVVGFLVPFLVVFIYLLWVHALSACAHTLFGLSLYYNGLYRKPLGFLFVHSVAPVGLLVLLWLIVVVVQREWNWEQWTLAGAALAGLTFYLLQGRGFSYYRYPLLVFLLTCISVDFITALSRRGLRAISVLAGIYGLLFLAPQCARKAVSYDWRNQEFINMLSSDLNNLGGQQLSGNVQCFDTIAGCVNTLYRDRLVQATGFLYDCYAYAPLGSRMMQVADRYRNAFLDALNRNPPEVLIVTDQYCQVGPDGYDKLKRWPQLESLIAGDYRLYTERMPPDEVYWWSRRLRPSGYRIYLHR